MDFIEHPPRPAARARVTAPSVLIPVSILLFDLKMLVKCDINVPFFNIL